jgi:methylase of polypeptide subunit release factors
MSSFGGAVAEAYMRVFECNAPAFDAVLAAVRADGFAGAREAGAPPLRVLDLASGPGEPATTLARALPGAEVTCTDYAPDMVTKAKVLRHAPARHARATHGPSRAPPR